MAWAARAVLTNGLETPKAPAARAPPSKARRCMRNDDRLIGMSFLPVIKALLLLA